MKSKGDGKVVYGKPYAIITLSVVQRGKEDTVKFENWNIYG